LQKNKGDKVMVEIAKLLASVTKGATVPSEHVDMMWATLVTGIVVVFLILILLVFILWLLGKVLNIKRKPKDIPAQVPASAQTAAPEVSIDPEEDVDWFEDDSEIIAVISAAIAAYGEADGKQYRIASVKRKEKSLRGNWSAAGIHENTRPF